MQGIELVKSFESALKLMSRFGIKATDCKHIALFEEYVSMRKAGHKVSYIEAVLSAKYRHSPRTISRIVKRLKSHVTF